MALCLVCHWTGLGLTVDRRMALSRCTISSMQFGSDIIMVWIFILEVHWNNGIRELSRYQFYLMATT